MSAALLTRVLARVFNFLTWPFVRYEYRGGACLAEHPTWIFSSNHRSVFDFPLAVSALHHFGQTARILIASEFWDHPVYVWGLRAIDAIPVFRRTDPQGSMAAAVGALKEGHSLCIMPEGTLHWDPEAPLVLGPMKSGVSRLAIGAGVPIIPVALVGTERLWRTGARIPRLGLRRKTVVCRLADTPLWLSGTDHRANARRVREATEVLVRQATRDLRELDPTYLPGVALPDAT